MNSMKSNLITNNTSDQVFVNRTLNLNNIKMIGFDMDYTLATYNVPQLEGKAFELVVERLIKDLGYPDEIRELKFDPNFIIRGLVIDQQLGNFLKVNRYGYVKRATHGTKFLSIEEQKKIYDTRGIDLTDPRFYIIHTLFSLAEGCLYARLIDWHEQRQKPFNAATMFKDIRTLIDEIHQDGSLKSFIIAEPQKYLIQDSKTVEALKKFRHYGKKLALITNSDYEYSQAVMHYCFDPFLPNSSWQDLFHIIIVASNKPGFFLQSQKFLKVDPKTGLLSNFHGPIEIGGIYQGGNARTFERDLGLKPSEILYLGDHILGDVVTLKKTTGWRTGLVVQELADEVAALRANRELLYKINAKMAEKELLENEFYAIKEELWDRHNRSENRSHQNQHSKYDQNNQNYQIDQQYRHDNHYNQPETSDESHTEDYEKEDFQSASMSALVSSHGVSTDVSTATDNASATYSEVNLKNLTINELEARRDHIRGKIVSLDKEITSLISEEQKPFNPYWGEVMRAGNEESRFATIVERYACIYMASIGNLVSYSPFKYFRPPRRYMAHDPL